MKLAEALTLRADLQRKIAQLKVRLLNNAKTQEGELPAEDPKALLEELNDCLKQYEELVFRINHTNCVIESEGLSLTQIIAKKDALTMKVNILRDFLESASEKIDRYSQKEIKIISTVNVSVLQKELDQYSKTLRELDTRLQSMNWTTDLI